MPQDRDRLILRASLDPLAPLQPTHSMMGNLYLKPWEGWYKAVEDLLPSCKDTFLTENQLIALAKHAIDPANPGGNYILERVGYGKRGPIIRSETGPAWTIRAMAGCDGKGGARSPATALLKNGLIKAIDYRCLARFQGFPSGYKWGPRHGPNAKAAGNAVPVLFAQRVIESIIGVKKP